MLQYVHVLTIKANVAVDRSPPASGLGLELRKYSSRFQSDQLLLATSRYRTAYEIENTTDDYQSLDLSFDRGAVVALGAQVFCDVAGWRLVDLFLRFTDYGCLNAVARLADTEHISPVSDLVQHSSMINRQLRDCIVDLDRDESKHRSLFKHLEELAFLRNNSPLGSSTSYSLLRSERFLWETSGLFATHVFVLAEPAEDRQAIAEALGTGETSIGFGHVNMTACLASNGSAILWTGESDDLAFGDMLYLVEPDTLCTAEQMLYTVGNLEYQEILQPFAMIGSKFDPTMKTSNRTARRGHTVRSQRSSELPSTKQLRATLIRDKLAISKVVSRSQDLDDDQTNYYFRYRASDPAPERLAHDFNQTEELLKYVVEAAEAAEKEHNDHFVQVILAWLTLLTVFAIINEGDDFLSRLEAWKEPKVLVVLAIVPIVLVIGALFTVGPLRRWLIRFVER